MRITADFNAEQGRYALTAIEFRAANGADIESATLRTIAPQRIMRWTLPRSFGVNRRTASPYATAFIAPDTVARDELPEPTLEDVAAVYKLAAAVRDARATAVAQALGVSVRTASRWIARAKDEGLLSGGLEERAAIREEAALDELWEIDESGT
ncbi:helix-turn-helix domain-containing protein [Demequina iriomotensis]|uniref:helix-turn-helix domain-containing protein n=1 Tax=Demequina iriomotensis TaxID=1536641 RepID=UPI00078457D0|nr:helix-turn-helix domain-containing protein [Demequina iriomotensis]